ncbi:hypothetical protein PTKIN_Ptkin11bG0097900 [Pterospermum kingtungense]
MLTLIGEVKDNVVTERIPTCEISVEERCWLVAKLFTDRPFNCEALLSTLKIIWRVAKEYEVSVLDSNLFSVQF